MIRPVIREALEMVYPRSCCGCGAALAGTDDNGLCWDCRSDSSALAPPWCEVCGLTVAGRVDHAFICADCQEVAPSFTRARSLYRYEGGVREAIHALKYRGDFSVIPDLSRILLAGLRTYMEDVEHLVLVPVPLHRKRKLHREFNQGEELIRGMRKLDGSLQVWTGVKRVKNTDTQTRLSKAGRKANVRNAFQVKRGSSLPERVVLVDDVMTTGATLDACAKALKKAGVQEVNALTLARG